VAVGVVGKNGEIKWKKGRTRGEKGVFSQRDGRKGGLDQWE